MSAGPSKQAGAIEARAQRLQGYLQQDPGNLALMSDLADAQMEAGRPDAARQTVQAALALCPEDPVWQYRMAVAERMTGELEAARARLVALVENDKREAALLQELARVCFALDDFAASLKALEALGEAPPLPRAVVASCVLMKVRALHHLNRLDDGIRVAEEWVRRHGESAGLTSALATLYLDAGRVREARDLFTAAESRGVADAEMLTTGGFVALNDGDAEAANDRFQRALAQQPGLGRACQCSARRRDRRTGLS
jgi:tetratricopeptide (TPR) repeat protein